MFSGIVEAIGAILQIEMQEGCKQFTISPNRVFNDLAIGESIAINGICLTVTEFTAEFFRVTAVPETLRLTNLDQLKLGSLVNLERAMQLTSRFGGHYVQGHVDGCGQVLEFNQDHSDALLVKISVPQHLAKYIVNKGYITLDGMSITVIQATDNWFTVTFIPHTQHVTIIKSQYQVGTKINIEVDIMSKYIEKLLEARTHASTI